jgi:hypothetical protein
LQCVKLVRCLALSIFVNNHYLPVDEFQRLLELGVQSLVWGLRDARYQSAELSGAALSILESNTMIRPEFNNITIEARVVGQLPVLQPLLSHNRYLPVHHQVTFAYRERIDVPADLGPVNELVGLLFREEETENGDDFVESRATISLASGM